MGAARSTRGSVILHRGVWYAVLTLERGKRHARRRWERCPAEIATETAARAYAEQLQARVDAGWDPTSKTSPIVPDVTLAAYVDAWLASRTYDSAPKDRESVARYLPRSPLGSVVVRSCRPRHIVAFVRWLKAHPSERGGTLAPRTVRSVYDAVRRALNGAVLDELLASNPCDPVRGELPPIVDKDPLEREGWEYAWSEIAALVYDRRIPLDRRVLNVLRFATGGRVSELAVLRIRDFEPDVEPLSRLTIRRARKSVSRTEGGTKTGAVKRVPLHPVADAIVREWIATGWEQHYGRKPTADDLLVPTLTLQPRHESKANSQFKRDCEAVGVRVLSQHKARHSFVTRIQDDGADGDVVRWITHAPPKTAFDGYTRQQWRKVCAEMVKLRFPSPPSVLGVDAGVDARGGETRNADVSNGVAWSGREDLKFWQRVIARLNARESAANDSPVSTDTDAVEPLALTLATPTTPRPDTILIAALEQWEADEIARQGAQPPQERPN